MAGCDGGEPGAGDASGVEEAVDGGAKIEGDATCTVAILVQNGRDGELKQAVIEWAASVQIPAYYPAL